MAKLSGLHRNGRQSRIAAAHVLSKSWQSLDRGENVGPRGDGNIHMPHGLPFPAGDGHWPGGFKRREEIGHETP